MRQDQIPIHLLKVLKHLTCHNKLNRNFLWLRARQRIKYTRISSGISLVYCWYHKRCIFLDCDPISKAAWYSWIFSNFSAFVLVHQWYMNIRLPIVNTDMGKTPMNEKIPFKPGNWTNRGECWVTGNFSKWRWQTKTYIARKRWNIFNF